METARIIREYKNAMKYGTDAQKAEAEAQAKKMGVILK